MKNTWTLKVKDFGEISSAEIRLTPFMMFVGENNSGKSYILQLLWGIFKNLNKLVNFDLRQDPKFLDLLTQLSNKRQQNIHGEDAQEKEVLVIDRVMQSQLIELLNCSLMKNKDWLMKEIFNHSVSISHLEIVRDHYFDFQVEIQSSSIHIPKAVKAEDSEEEKIIELPHKVDIYDLKVVKNHDDIEMISRFAIEKKQNNNNIPQRVLLQVIDALVCLDFAYSNIRAKRKGKHIEPVYFPASRTGFMHTYQAILGNERKKLREQLDTDALFVADKGELFLPTYEPTLRLTAPVLDFLEKLSDIFIDEDQQKKYIKEIEFMNTYVFNGKVTVDQANNYRFITDTESEGLPLHVTSSLVAELAPLSIFLSSQYDPQLFIIEESESHLHVNKQLELVRLFFRLINKGKAIWLTTHSDSFAQQVNNLLTLSQSNHKEKLFAQLGYEAIDTLTDVAGSSCYQFRSEQGKTVVEELSLEEYGFIIPTFNTALERLLFETSVIQSTGDTNE